MAGLNKNQLDFVRRMAPTLNDKKIAEQLGVDVREVRKARKQLGLDRPSAESRTLPAVMPTCAPASDSGVVQTIGSTARVINHPLILWPGLLGLLAAAVYAQMLPIFNTDIGWHLALGRYMVENRTVALSEPLSHTAPGVHTVAHEWLSQVVCYLVTRAGGVLALRWAHALLVAGILLLLFVLMRRQSVPAGLAVLGIYAYFIIGQGRFHVRPHMIDLAALLIMYGWLFVYKPGLSRAQLAAIFIAMVVWANLHSGAVLMVMLMALYVGAELVQQRIGWRKPAPADLGRGQPRRLLVLMGLMCVALVLTPNHFHLFPYIVKSKLLNARHSQEWQSIAGLLGDPSQQFLAVEAYWVMLVLMLAACVRTLLRRGSLAEMGVALFLAVLPLTGQRFVASTFVPVMYILAEFTAWSSVRIGDRVPAGRRMAGAVASIVGPLAVIGLAYLTLKPSFMQFRGPHQSRFWRSVDFRSGNLPVEACEILDAVRLDGKLFHPGDWGGYVAWRLYGLYPVFIDGRWVEFGEKLFLDSLAIERRRPNAFDLLDQYDIDVLLLPREWFTRNDPKREEWICVFENFLAGVYVRNTPRNHANLQRCAAYYEPLGIPFSMTKGFSELAARRANVDWCNRYYVQRYHLNRGKKPMVPGW